MKYILDMAYYIILMSFANSTTPDAHRKLQWVSLSREYAIEIKINVLNEFWLVSISNRTQKCDR